MTLGYITKDIVKWGGNTMSKKIVIIGSGVAGLASAVRLQSKGF